MTCKKTWFSYILWAFYSIIVCICLAMGILTMISGRMDPIMMIGIVCLFFLGFTAIFYLGQILVNQIGRGRQIKKKVAFGIELFFVLAGVIGSIVWEILLLFSADEGRLLQSACLSGSFVKEGSGVPEAAYGAEWMLLHMLRGLFLLVGNHAQAAVLFQMVLQLSGSFLLYRGLRKLYGRFAGTMGLWGMLLLGSWPFWQECFGFGTGISEVLQPFWAAAFFFCLGLYLLCSFLTAYQKGGLRSKAGFAAIFAIGVYLAAVLYLDFYGVLLVLFGCGILWWIPREEELRTGFAKRIVTVLLLLVGVFTGLVFLFGMRSVFEGESFGKVVAEWWKAYTIGTGGSFVPAFGQMELIAFITLSALLFWGIFCFLKNSGEERLSGIFLMFFSVAVLQAVGIGAAASDVWWLFFIMIICGAVILGQCFRPLKKVEAEIRSEDKTEDKTGDKTEEKTEENSVEKAEQKPEIKFLENPLPGPKKHVAKTLDYDLQEDALPKKEMDYDLQIAEDDDFDLK